MKSFISWNDKPRKHLGSKNTSTATSPDISERFGNEHVDEHSAESGEAVSPVYSSPGGDTSTSKGHVKLHTIPPSISNKSPLIKTNKFRFTTTTDSSPGGDEPWDSATAAPVYSSLGEDTSTSKGHVKVHAMPHPISISSEEDEPWASEDSPSTSEPTGNAQVLEIPGLVEASSKDEPVPEDVLEYLALLQKNPSLFVTVYKMLVKKGVKFPDLRKPIRHITYNGKRIRLSKKVIAAYPVKINERLFTLPKDAKKFARFVSENPEKLPVAVIVIQQLGGTVTPDRAGKLKGFKLFGKTTNFPKATHSQSRNKRTRFQAS
ncbi:hypothetical protein HPB48_016586 [Haemaphysalis longicornis]|uniref:Uncharacterized protein n=1 Tax=Haemaphysalis longicornis TaxID=44386 RepID=A0A9J6GHA5_HAELO|nr:hypothetical protein HPB48_016586 [Haemaphysalis longicornis]